jgi:hypothetical protein
MTCHPVTRGGGAPVHVLIFMLHHLLCLVYALSFHDHVSFSGLTYNS